MTAATLWIEMTIAGSVYVMSLCFLVMAIWYPSLNFQSLASRAHDFLGYVSVAFVALSYVFGFVAHRVIQGAIYWGRLLAEKYHDRRLSRNDRPNRRTLAAQQLAKTLMEEMEIWTRCSARVHREMDFQFTQRALLRSLAVSSLFLVASFCCWRRPTLQTHLLVGIACFVAFYAGLIIALVRQSRQYKMIRGDALRVAREDPSYWTPMLSPDRGKAGTKITIRGINFGTFDQRCTVSFDNSSIPLAAWTPTEIAILVPSTVRIPAGKEGHCVAVTVNVDMFDLRSNNAKYELQLKCPPFTVTI